MNTAENKKPRNRKYYGVAGVNAYGVYTNYGKVLDAQKYINQFNCKRYPDLNSAKEWAVERYNKLQDNSMEYEISKIKEETGLISEAQLLE